MFVLAATLFIFDLDKKNFTEILIIPQDDVFKTIYFIYLFIHIDPTHQGFSYIYLIQSTSRNQIIEKHLRVSQAVMSLYQAINLTEFWTTFMNL